jgi:AcrR family transcriptional regulator
MHPAAAAANRRTQEERTTATRAKLLDATIESLHEVGYGGTTTTEVARRAGVSRGAQLHHFPTRAELVTTAVEHLFERRRQEFLDAFRKLPPEADRVQGAVDLLWSVVSGPTFYAWLEIIVAARTDAELRRSVAAMAERFIETVRQTFLELFPERGGPFFDIAPTFALALMQGLAVEQMLVKDDARIRRTLEMIKLLGHLTIPHGRS